MKKYAAVMAALLLSGCQLIPQNQTSTEGQVEVVNASTGGPDCVFVTSALVDAARCDISFWLDYWAQVDQLPWPTRLSLIEELGDQPDEVLQKVILSQPVNTPYKARLRAQHWFEGLYPELSDVSQKQLTAIVAKPSEHMLEFESAITVLSKINNGQDKTIATQEQQINELKAQLEALLNIESNLMNQEEETKQ